MGLKVFTLDRVVYSRGDDFVLGPIGWDISEHGVSTILGPSGSGKTSLLRLLNRLDDPASGEIRYGDRPVMAMEVKDLRREVGMVFQRPELFPGTVQDNLLFGPNLHGNTIDIGRILAVVGLPAQMLGRDVTTLSGGEAQKVSIGRAIAADPRVLLLDEPTSGLDPTATLQIENLVRDLVRRLGLTCVFVTHDVAQARRLGDSALLLIDGKKVEEGPMAEVLENPKDPRTLRFIRGELA
jgi:putative ABC transport system ATP-binding protein